jgi:hypothetical protein
VTAIRRRRAIAALLGAPAVLALLAGAALAASPSPSPPGGDVQTNPTAPGVVGDPLFAVAGVLVVALLAAGVTLLATRLTERR